MYKLTGEFRLAGLQKRWNMRPIIGITMGDPASIGSEQSVYEKTRPIVIGDISVMQKALDTLNKVYPAGAGGVKAFDLKLHRVDTVEEASFDFGTIDVMDMGLVDIDELRIGEVSEMAGEAAFRYVVKDIELAMAGKVDATVTNAFNKAAINLAGHHYSGHTEVYAEYTNTKHYTMMLAHEDLRVVHVSTHVSLREACDRVGKERVLAVIRIADDACRQLGIQDPRIGVAGLNPHSGEGGLFGREEIEEIIPAMEEARKEGINVDGPVPPDTVFSKALGGWYDIVVAMYHDQGHIPLKVKGFVYNREKQKWDAVSGVNITLGLPIIRVSVDHGTAFDQAGTGTATALSLLNSIEYAALMAANRK